MDAIPCRAPPELMSVAWNDITMAMLDPATGIPQTAAYAHTIVISSMVRIQDIRLQKTEALSIELASRVTDPFVIGIKSLVIDAEIWRLICCYLNKLLNKQPSYRRFVKQQASCDVSVMLSTKYWGQLKYGDANPPHATGYNVIT